jgi:ribosomal protein S3
MRMNAEGIKVLISGRLNGAEMVVQKVSKKEESLSTFRAILIMH